jgi:hypothetical protein
MCVPAAARGARVSHRHDLAATRAYLRAIALDGRESYLNVPAGAAAIEARAREIGSQCAGALTYAPRDEAFNEIAEEAAQTIFLAALGPLRGELRRFARALQHLTWSNRKLTRLVHERAAEEAAYAALVLPDVCGDIERWKTGSYAQLPASVGAFLEHALKLEVAPLTGPRLETREAVILRLLTHWESARERRDARRSEARERRAGERIDAAWSDAKGKLATALGVAAL